MHDTSPAAASTNLCSLLHSTLLSAPHADFINTLGGTANGNGAYFWNSLTPATLPYSITVRGSHMLTTGVARAFQAGVSAT